MKFAAWINGEKIQIEAQDAEQVRDICKARYKRAPDKVKLIRNVAQIMADVRN